MILSFRLNLMQENGTINQIDYLLSEDETRIIDKEIVRDMLLDTQLLENETDISMVVLEIDTIFCEKDVPFIVLSFIADLFHSELDRFCEEKGITRQSKHKCVKEFVESGNCWSNIQQPQNIQIIPLKLDRLFMFFDYMLRNNNDDSNIQKKIKKKCDNLGLEILNGRPYIRVVELTEEQQKEISKVAYDKSNNDYFGIKSSNYNKIFNVKKYEKSHTIIIYYRSVEKNVTFYKNLFYEIHIMDTNKIDNKKPKTLIVEQKEVRNYNLNSVCNLYRDLLHNRRKLEFTELLGLFSNMVYMNVKSGKTEKVGKNYLLDMLKKCKRIYENEVIEGWKIIGDYMKRTSFKAMPCIEYCPYATECTHLSTLLETVTIPLHTIIKVNQDERYEELGVVQDKIRNKIEEVFEYFKCNGNKSFNPMYLIKAGTGTHKTTIASQIAIEYSKTVKCIYAVDTIRLKYQMQEDFIKQGFTDFIMTPDLELIDDIRLKRKIKQYQSAGKFITLNKMLEQLVEENKEKREYKPEDVEIIENYLEVNKKLQDGKFYKDKLILTTHKRLPFLKQAKDRLVIIDEDIFGSNFYEIVDIPVSKIKEVCDDSDIVKEKLQRMVRVIDKLEYCEQHSVIPVQKGWWDSELRAIIESEIPIKETGNINIFNLFDCISVRRLCNDKERMKNKEPVSDDLDYVRCYIRRKLPIATTIVLSASLESDFYKNNFPNHLVEDNIYADVKYKYPVIQLTTNTYSRQYIKRNKDKVKDLIEESGMLDMSVITFKDVIRDNPSWFNNIELYDNYYAIQGNNKMAGKDLRLIGKPTRNEGYYMFLASMIYRKNYNDKIFMHNQIVSYEGYLFYMFTYDDEYLKKIQLWDTTSQQEQSVGRPRPIENEVNIELYSCVPVKQSILEDIDDYVVEDENIEEDNTENEN